MIAFTFPGQGSQSPAMGEAWSDHPSWELVDEASEAASRDIGRLLLHADKDELTETHNAQLATFTASMMVLDAVERLGVEPTALAGHSLGEYSALTAAGVLSFSDGVRLVAERGEAMRLACDEQVGTMAAVLGADDDIVVQACEETDDDVWVANFNAPGQVVIAGSPTGIELATARVKELGAKRVLPIAVSGAFHTPFMSAARERLQKALGIAEFRDADNAVYANVDASAHTLGVEWADLLTTQLTSPVRWRRTLYELTDAGVTTFVELGPGTVLTGLAKRTVKGSRTLSVATPTDLDSLLVELSKASETEYGPLEGEHLFATERLVVSPTAGIFSPMGGLSSGETISVGSTIGNVGDDEVRSPFQGALMGMLAFEGERVTASQPIAWLRSSALAV